MSGYDYQDRNFSLILDEIARRERIIERRVGIIGILCNAVVFLVCALLGASTMINASDVGEIFLGSFLLFIAGVSLLLAITIINKLYS